MSNHITGILSPDLKYIKQCVGKNRTVHVSQCVHELHVRRTNIVSWSTPVLRLPIAYGQICLVAFADVDVIEISPGTASDEHLIHVCIFQGDLPNLYVFRNLTFFILGFCRCTF